MIDQYYSGLTRTMIQKAIADLLSAQDYAAQSGLPTEYHNRLQRTINSLNWQLAKIGRAVIVENKRPPQ